MQRSGDSFIKYGRYGQPHLRFVYISDDGKFLVWCVKQFDIKDSQQQAGGTVMQGVETKVKRISISEIEDVRTGVKGSLVLKRFDLPKETDNLVFSVITKQRSLDLKANDSATRNRWVKYLHTLINSKTKKQNN